MGNYVSIYIEQRSEFNENSLPTHQPDFDTVQGLSFL